MSKRMPSAAAIYARISSDDGTALGVARQIEDCRRLAGDLGWAVAEEYVDNDVSAHSGKKRLAYERMLTDLRDGMRDGVLVHHVDRLTRRPIELEEFVAVVDAAGLKQVRFVMGDMDFGSGDGLMIARIQAAMAANESATKSRRVRRKMDQNAQAGRPHGGYQRPFGFEDDKVTIRVSEAQVIRDLAERYLAGESLRSLATWLDERGVRTVAGGPWRTPTLRAMLRSGRIAGLREHRGQVIGPAMWKAIITEQQRTRIIAKMDDAAVAVRRSPRRYLLSGLLRCGQCGNRLFSSPRASSRRYVCLSGPDHGGCGRLTVTAPALEEFLTEVVLYRLDTPELEAALAGQTEGDQRIAVLAEEVAADREQLEELADLYARKQISAREWMAARNPIEARIRSAETTLTRASGSDALAGWIGTADTLRQQWSQLNLTRQHAIVAAVLDHAVILPGISGARSLDPARVSPVWRL